MYSVVQIGGHQYMLKAGDIVDVQKLDQEVGAELKLDQVLLVNSKETLVGKPTVSGATVTAKVIRQDRGRKQIVFKRKPGGYQRKNGHRQYYTSLLITELNDGNGNTANIDKDSKLAKTFLK